MCKDFFLSFLKSRIYLSCMSIVLFAVRVFPLVFNLMGTEIKNVVQGREVGFPPSFSCNLQDISDGAISLEQCTVVNLKAVVITNFIER